MVVFFVAINYFFNQKIFLNRLFLIWFLIIFIVVTDVYFERLNGTNLLNTMIFRPMIDTPELNLLQMAEFNFLKPQAKITLTYNFGNKNVKSKKIKSSEESRRINTTSSD